MPTDFFVAFAFWPVAIASAALLGMTFRWRKAQGQPGVVSSRQIVRGYFGVLVAVLLYAAVDTTVIGFEKVGLGHIQAGDLPTWIPHWTLYMFVLLTPIYLLVCTVVGLPLFLWLRRVRLASVAGVLLLAVVISAFFAAFVSLKPYNSWCANNLAACVTSNFLEALLPAVLLALGFAGAAPLPLFRSKHAI